MCFERQKVTRCIFSLYGTNFYTRVTLLTAPRKSEGLDSAAGLNAKDEVLMLSKKSYVPWMGGTTSFGPYLTGHRILELEQLVHARNLTRGLWQT